MTLFLLIVCLAVWGGGGDDSAAVRDGRGGSSVISNHTIEWAETYCRPEQVTPMRGWLDEVLPGRNHKISFAVPFTDAEVIFNCRTTMKPQLLDPLERADNLLNKIDYRGLRDDQRVMHVPGITPLLNMKTGLCLTMQRAEAAHGPEISSNYPQCFFVPGQRDRLRRFAAEQPDAYVLHKYAMDAGSSSQFLSRSSQFVKSAKFNVSQPGVVQRYVERPVLKEGFKTDIRLFGALFFDPPRVYLSRFGVYKSCNSTPDHYRLDDSTVGNRKMHFSNSVVSYPKPEQVPENEFVEGPFIWGTLRQWFRHIRREGKLDVDELWLQILHAATKPVVAVQDLVSCRGPRDMGAGGGGSKDPDDWAHDPAGEIRRKQNLTRWPTTQPQAHKCGGVWQDLYVDVVVDDEGRAYLMEMHMSDGNFKAARLMFDNFLLAQWYNVAALSGLGIGIADKINQRVHQFCVDTVDSAIRHGLIRHRCSDPKREFGLPECLGTYERKVLIRMGTEHHFARQREMDSALPRRWPLYRQLLRRSRNDTQLSWHEMIFHAFDRSQLVRKLELRGINPMIAEDL